MHHHITCTTCLYQTSPTLIPISQGIRCPQSSWIASYLDASWKHDLLETVLWRNFSHKTCIYGPSLNSSPQNQIFPCRVSLWVLLILVWSLLFASQGKIQSQTRGLFDFTWWIFWADCVNNETSCLWVEERFLRLVQGSHSQWLLWRALFWGGSQIVWWTSLNEN